VIKLKPKKKRTENQLRADDSSSLELIHLPFSSVMQTNFQHKSPTIPHVLERSIDPLHLSVHEHVDRPQDIRAGVSVILSNVFFVILSRSSSHLAQLISGRFQLNVFSHEKLYPTYDLLQTLFPRIPYRTAVHAMGDS
tara:strand:- start:3081 stop:3494 length:414 start_codon:yes stop_codon:yes gene_type:complete